MQVGRLVMQWAKGETSTAAQRDATRGRGLAGLLIALAVLTSVAMIVVSAFRKQPLTQLELAQFQVIALGLGLGGSYAFRSVDPAPCASGPVSV